MMDPPDFLSSIPPSLAEQLRSGTNKLLSRIVRANHDTKFARAAPEHAEFRRLTAGLQVDGMDDDVLSELFRRTVQLTTYDSYAPFIKRFFWKTGKERAVVNLFAPGLPDYLVMSSSTSGGLPKKFPKYDRLSKTRSLGVVPSATPGPLKRRTTAYVWYLGSSQITVKDGNDCSIATIYLTSVTAMYRRDQLSLNSETVEEKMGLFLLDHAAPCAVGFIRNWRSFLLMHALFALSSRSLETMSMGFLNAFVDMMRHLDTKFDMIVDCIATGTIPDLDGITGVQHYLEINISPDPERAVELRNLGPPSSRQGWCGYVWPNLRSVSTVASGSFASSIPMARWFLGPNAEIHSRGYGSAEAWIGWPYSPLKLDQFKLNDENLIEFLDISKTSKSDSIDALAQIWDIGVGRRYEVVLTTLDGLWRYRLGDVIEVCGFDPTDGIPIVQFVERRNVVIRFPNFMITERELRAALSSVTPNVFANIVGWTTTVDDRCLPRTIGFFVELAGDQDSDPAPAAELILEELTRSSRPIAADLARGQFRKPTIRLVRPGTFSDFLQLKLDEDSCNLGQIKIPIVLPKATYVAWFVNQVVREL